MSRGDKGDSTQPLSDSQVVAVSKQPSVDKHDRSVWKGLVVGADEFAPAAKPRRSPARWVIAGVLVAGAGGFAAYELAGSSGHAPAVPAPPPAPAAVATPAPVASPPADAAPPAIDAAIPPIDAAAAEPAATRPTVPAPPAKKKKHPPRKRRTIQ